MVGMHDSEAGHKLLFKELTCCMYEQGLCRHEKCGEREANDLRSLVACTHAFA